MPEDPQRATAIAAEEATLRDTLPTVTVAGTTFWVGEGDLRLDGPALRRLAAARVDARSAPPPADGRGPSGLVAITDDQGRVRRWRRGSTLTYSLHRHSFDTEPDYVRVATAMAAACAAWAEVTGLRFVHRVALDAEHPLPPAVTFVVQQQMLPGFVALAFFPGDAPLTRVLQVDPSWFSTQYDPVGVFRHELGHVLGFRHEHVRAAPIKCQFGEDIGADRALTDYDPRSVMHYPCGALGTKTFALTESDIAGARLVYVEPEDAATAATFVDSDPGEIAPPPVAVAPPPAVPAPGLTGEWQYTTALLTGVPMLDTRGVGLPRSEKPRIGWFVKVAEVAAELALNRAAGVVSRVVPGGAGLAEPAVVDLEHLAVADLHALDQGAERAAERAVIDAFVRLYGDRTVDELPALDPAAGLGGGPSGVVRAALAVARLGLTDPLAIARQILRNAPRAEASADPHPTLADYQALFQTVPIPAAFAAFPVADDVFAELRVAGYDPMVVHRADAAPFGVDDALLSAATGAGDTVAAALADGRLFVCDYSDVAFPPLDPSTVPHGRKFGFAPTLTLALPPGAGPRALRPVAIRLDSDSPFVVGPSDRRWGWAKLAVDQADANRHELVDHLARTHLLAGTIAVGTRRCLPDAHPVARLLWPHFEGTLSINDTAVSGLLGPGAPVDQALAGTIDSSKRLAAAARLSQPFARYALPADLAARGVDGDAVYFPYRDDARLVWDAIAAFTLAYVTATFPGGDAAVAADPMLRRWQAELAAPGPGLIRGFGEATGDDGVGAPFTTLAGLAHALATIVFVASAQHAAVNFPQRGLMSYAPGVAGALYSGAVDADRLVTALPPLDVARLQLEFLSLLGGVHYTKLGDYRDGALPADAGAAVGAFRAALAAAEQEITARNTARVAAGRLAYPYLLPSQIPQSINV